jgi:hypothetical protein
MTGQLKSWSGKSSVEIFDGHFEKNSSAKGRTNGKIGSLQ